MTATSLRAYSLKDLAQMARRRGVNGWHAMRKDQLVAVLARAAQRRRRVARRLARKSVAPVRRSNSRSAGPSRQAIDAGSQNQDRFGRQVEPQSSHPQTLGAGQGTNGSLEGSGFATVNNGNGTVHNINGVVRDRLVVMVRGPFWLHACWELRAQSIQRAQVAMGQDWHTARPVLRLFHVTNAAASSSSERVLRDIEIHGGVKNWYIDVKEAPQTYRVEIGYLSVQGPLLLAGPQQHRHDTPAARPAIRSTPTGATSPVTATRSTP